MRMMANPMPSQSKMYQNIFGINKEDRNKYLHALVYVFI